MYFFYFPMKLQYHQVTVEELCWIYVIYIQRNRFEGSLNLTQQLFGIYFSNIFNFFFNFCLIMAFLIEQTPGRVALEPRATAVRTKPLHMERRLYQLG